MLVHADEGGGVEGVRGGAAAAHDVGLVETDVGLTGDGALSVFHGVLEVGHLGGEPESVVDELGVLKSKLVTDAHNLAVKAEKLEVVVSSVEDGSTGGLVAATGLETNVTVLNNINAANTVLATDLVQVLEHLKGSGDLSAVGLVDDLAGDTGLEGNEEVHGGVGGVHDVLGFLLEHEARVVLRAGEGRVLKFTRLVGDVEKVLILTVRVLLGGSHGDVELLGVLEEVLATLELLAVLRLTPEGHALELGVHAEVAELEANLVVTLAGGAVADVGGVLVVGDLDLALADAGASDGGTEKVASLVDGVGGDHGVHKVLDELLAKVLAVKGVGSAELSLLLDLLLGSIGDDVILAEVSDVGSNLKAELVHEVGELSARVEATRVCENELGLALIRLAELGAVERLAAGSREAAGSEAAGGSNAASAEGGGEHGH